MRQRRRVRSCPDSRQSLHRSERRFGPESDVRRSHREVILVWQTEYAILFKHRSIKVPRYRLLRAYGLPQRNADDMNAKVFISHSSNDQKVAKTICTALEHRGLA